jgi:hypothetical protein
MIRRYAILTILSKLFQRTVRMPPTFVASGIGSGAGPNQVAGALIVCMFQIGANTGWNVVLNDIFSLNWVSAYFKHNDNCRSNSDLAFQEKS